MGRGLEVILPMGLLLARAVRRHGCGMFRGERVAAFEKCTHLGALQVVYPSLPVKQVGGQVGGNVPRAPRDGRLQDVPFFEILGDLISQTSRVYASWTTRLTTNVHWGQSGESE